MTAIKILIIEDDQQIRLALARILGSNNYAITVAGDAVSAVSSAVREKPDLILLDLGLPAGSGTLVLERLRNLPNSAVTPVIVITGGFVDVGSDQILKNLGCDTILTKPISADQLLAAVSAAMGDAASPTELLGQS
jgi:DNA-binding response OmpR family regulator